MARPIRQTASGAGALPPVILNNLNVSPFNVGIGVDLSAGATLTYTVEHTFADVFAASFNPATATWYPNTNLTAQTTSKDSNYAYPVTAVRLNVTAHTGGTATMTTIQAN